MSIQVRDGAAANLLGVEPNTKTALVAQRGVDVLTGGAFRLAAATGDLTAVAAGTSSAGHLFAFRWGSASMLALIQRLRVRWQTNAGFTAAQLIGVDASIVRGYTASHSGGAAITTSGDNMAKRASHATSVVTDVRISTTGALTNGTETFDANPIAQGFAAELAAAATVQKNYIDILFEAYHGQEQPIVLAQNEGIVVRNLVLMGAGGTARVVVEVDWVERASY